MESKIENEIDNAAVFSAHLRSKVENIHRV